MKNFLALSTLILSSVFAKAQTCNTNNVTSNPDRYKLQENFIPNSTDAVKTFRLNFHFLENGDVDDNFEQGNTAHDDFLDLIVDKLNYIYSELDYPSDPKTCVCGSGCHIEDSRIRFELVNKYYHYDPSNYGTGSITYLRNNYAAVDEGVFDYFFVGENGGTIGGATVLPSNTDLERVQLARGSNYFAQYLAGGTAWNANDVARNIAHELGHGLALLHLYDATGAIETTNTSHHDYLDDFMGAGTGSCPQISLPTTEWCNDAGSPSDQCSRNMMGGSSHVGKRELTPKQIGRIHRSSMLTSARQYFKVTSNLVADHEVTSNETWDFNIRMYGNIVVKEGATLTIRCKVLMPPTSKIMVEQGAELIIDGGTITSVDDNNMWHGIEVFGTSNKSQYPYSGGTMYQGKMIAKNNAVIENALDAVTNWDPSNFSKSGGILQATNTTFRNNRRSVSFIAYQNHVPNSTSQTLNDLSFFKGCTFVHNAALNNAATPWQMVTLWGIKGVQFLGCNFKYDNYNPSFFQKTAIYSIDAMYNVKSYCTSLTYPCPAVDQVHSTFNNLDRGVIATGSGVYAPVKVLGADFSDVDISIVVDEVNSCELVDNTITTTGEDCSYGIYVYGSTGYIIEGNDISAGTGSIDQGIYIKNSGSAYNEVYRNDISDLQWAIVSSGTNYYAAQNNPNWNGLKFLCNDFSGNTSRDLYVNSSPGAAEFQGTLDASTFIPVAAGNTFTDAGTVNLHIRNCSSCPTTKYFYYASGIDEQPTLLSNAATYEAGQRGCGVKKSEFTIGKMTSSTLSIRKSDFMTANNDYNSAIQDYTNGIDGGNTTSLLNTIDATKPGDDRTLTTKLIGESPLSNEVILKAIEVEILNNSQLFSIISKTPSAMTSPVVISALENQSNPMDPIDIGKLVDMTVDLDARDELIAAVSYYGELRAEYLSDVVNHYEDLTDTIDNDSLLVWLSILNGEHEGKISEVSSLISFGDISTAQSVMTTWSSKPSANSEESTHKDLYIDFMDDYMDNFFDAAGSSVWPTSSTYLSSLSSLVSQENIYTSSMARNILRFDALEEYHVHGSASYKTTSQSLYDKYRDIVNPSSITEALASQLDISVYPNPSLSTFTVAIPSEEDQNFTVSIYDLKGNLVHEIFTSQKEVTISHPMETGTYIVQVSAQSRILGESILEVL